MDNKKNGKQKLEGKAKHVIKLKLKKTFQTYVPLGDDNH